MMRRSGGRETWHSLLEWDKGQPESERLAARLLPFDGYEHIDPSHPLGGRDGGRDILCSKDGKKVAVAVYFPRGQKKFREIKDKFKSDLAGATAQDAEGFVFFTNQELSLGQRAELENLAESLTPDIYHLERIASSLDTPRGYGLRLEFLSIEMTKEEQVSFFNDRDQVLYEIRDSITSLVKKKQQQDPGIQWVPVEQHSNAIYASPSGSKLVECKRCGEVFRAMPSYTTFLVNLDSIKTVTCPACGKVQAYK
jgi:hypothetical protein